MERAQPQGARVDRDVLVSELNRFLNVDAFQDYCPNGLQIEGRATVARVMTGVTASLALIDAAIEWQADALLVHHGYFWKGEPAPLVGLKGRRVARLLGAGINLLAYHLPLDAHPVVGNNAVLGRDLGLERLASLRADGIGDVGVLRDPLTPAAFAERIAAALGRTPLWLPGGPPRIRRVAWCTGAAQGFLADAAARGADAYVSGEVSERTTHEARELGIHFFAAGHHATERGGPRALGGWLAERFGVVHRFVDLDNPV